MTDRVSKGARSRLRTHSVHIENRELASITGVKDVGSFNESMVVLMRRRAEDLQWKEPNSILRS